MKKNEKRKDQLSSKFAVRGLPGNNPWTPCTGTELVFDNRRLGGPFHITTWKTAPATRLPHLRSLRRVQVGPVCREHRVPRRSPLHKPSVTLGVTAREREGRGGGLLALRMFWPGQLAIPDAPRAATWKRDPVVVQRARSSRVSREGAVLLQHDGATRSHRKTHPYPPPEKNH